MITYIGKRKENFYWIDCRHWIRAYNLFNVSITRQEATIIIFGKVSKGNLDLVITSSRKLEAISTFEFGTQVSGNVVLKGYGLLGREIATLVDEYKSAGSHKEIFNSSNKMVPSGIYLYKLTVGNFTQTRKMILMK